MKAVLAAASLVDASQRFFAAPTIQTQPVAYGNVAAGPVYGGSVNPYLQPMDTVQLVATAEPAWGLSDLALLAAGAILGGSIVYHSKAKGRAVGADNLDLESGTRIAALAVDGSRVPAPGRIYNTSGKPVKGVKNSFLSYDVCTLGGQGGDIGVLPPLGCWDPLGLIETKDMRRWEIMEIKHGRAAMLAFLHVIHIEAGVRFPGYLSGSAELKFTDVPAGLFASLEAIPKAGWLQILAVALACETGFAGRPFGVVKQTDDREPGDIGASGWVRYQDPATRAFKLNVERQNGRAAMLGITGCLVHELLGVDALYPTGGLGGAAPPQLVDPETCFSQFPAFSTFLLGVFVLREQLTSRTGGTLALPRVGAGFNGGRPFNGSRASSFGKAGGGARAAKAAPARKAAAPKPKPKAAPKKTLKAATKPKPKAPVKKAVAKKAAPKKR
jgi:hypothetical protein